MSTRNTRIRREQKRSIIERQDYNIAADIRKRRLFNYRYHKSLLFLATHYFRIFFLVFFTWLLTAHGGGGKVEKEVITKVIDWDQVVKYPVSAVELNFSTNQGDYEAEVQWRRYPYIKVGDTILMQYTAFGKAISFKNRKETTWYNLYINWVFLGLIAFIIGLSLMYTDGLEKITHQLVKITWIAGIAGFLYYFFFC